jgi:phosphatidate cytidylyltransferase
VKEIHKRVLTGLCLAPPIVIVFYFLPAQWFFVFMALVATLAVFELVNMAGIEKKYLLTILALVCLIPLYRKSMGLYLLCLLFTPVIYIFAVAVMRGGERESINLEIMTALNTLFLGELFLVLPLYYFYLLKEIGVSVPLILLFAIWASDTTAFIFGKSFGKRPLVPTISPKKTCEGLAGAMVGPMIILVLFRSPLGLGIAEALSVGAIIGILGQTGDIFESIWKRVCKVKDSSGLIPGHGGILDRIDSFIFTAPFLYHYVAGMKI